MNRLLSSLPALEAMTAKNQRQEVRLPIAKMTTAETLMMI